MERKNDFLLQEKFDINAQCLSKLLTFLDQNSQNFNFFEMLSFYSQKLSLKL